MTYRTAIAWISGFIVAYILFQLVRPDHGPAVKRIEENLKEEMQLEGINQSEVPEQKKDKYPKPNLPGMDVPQEPKTQPKRIEEIIRPEVSSEQEITEVLQKIKILDPEELSGEEKESLRWLLRSKVNETVRNNVAVVLIKAAYPPVSGTAAQGLRDKTQSDVWRNYCVQILAECYAKVNKEKDIIQELFRAVEEDPAALVRDAALYHLSEIAVEDNWWEAQPQWREKVIALAKEFMAPEKPQTDQISGIRATARLGQKQYVDEWVKKVNNESKPVPIRRAIIAALGTLANELDEEQRIQVKRALEKAATSRNEKFSKLAQTELEKLKFKN